MSIEIAGYVLAYSYGIISTLLVFMIIMLRTIKNKDKTSEEKE